MAKVEYLKCDKCGKFPANQCATLLERRSDGAGSREDWHLVFDLCPNCSVLLLGAALDDLGVEQASLLLSRYKVETREG
jgi:hypothetical protein